MRATIASGAGRYADPWHPFDETSACLAAILKDAGFTVTIDDDVDHAMSSLTDIDLLCVNAGDSWRSTEVHLPAPSSAIDGFSAALDRGIGVLALHCAASSLRDYPEWAPAIGRMWVPGLSFHPPADLTSISSGKLPDGRTVDGFDIFDERYCRLQEIGRSHTVCTHPGDQGGTEPTAWVREVGRSRVAVDLLGHDRRSFEAAGHRELLRQLALWTVHDGGAVLPRD